MRYQVQRSLDGEEWEAIAEFVEIADANLFIEINEDFQEAQGLLGSLAIRYRVKDKEQQATSANPK